jgi:hypothetical protein
MAMQAYPQANKGGVSELTIKRRESSTPVTEKRLRAHVTDKQPYTNGNLQPRFRIDKPFLMIIIPELVLSMPYKIII